MQNSFNAETYIYHIQDISTDILHKNNSFLCANHTEHSFISCSASFQIWQQDGSFVTEYAADGVFDFPHGIATTTAQHIVVTDVSLHCVKILNPNGCLRNSFGSYGNQINKFDHPYSVAVNSQNHIIVSDQGNTSIKCFSIDGKILQYFNLQDFRLPSECFIMLHGITVDNMDNILVIGNSSVYICAQDGRFWEVLIPAIEESLHSPKCLAFSSLNQLVVTQIGEDSQHEVSIFHYSSEDFHALKYVNYLSCEAKMKKLKMQKARSLDSAAAASNIEITLNGRTIHSGHSKPRKSRRKVQSLSEEPVECKEEGEIDYKHDHDDSECTDSEKKEGCGTSSMVECL